MAVSESNSIEDGKFDYEWDVYSLCYKPKSKYGMILLNTSLNNEGNKKHFIDLWTKASFRICVDGGTNDFYHYVYKDEFQPSGNPIPIPDVISGDLDSVEPELLDFFKDLGTRVVQTPDQNETDFTKSLMVFRNYNTKKNMEIKLVLVVGGMSCNRFDHVLSQIHTVYKMLTVMSYPIIVICGSSLYWLLKEGYHRINIPPSVLKDKEKSWCGYASLNEPVIVSTSGLKFDVGNKKVMFGEMISSSNTYCEDSKGFVDIKCSKPLLWFMGWDRM